MIMNEWESEKKQQNKQTNEAREWIYWKQSIYSKHMGQAITQDIRYRRMVAGASDVVWLPQQGEKPRESHGDNDSEYKR